MHKRNIVDINDPLDPIDDPLDPLTLNCEIKILKLNFKIKIFMYIFSCIFVYSFFHFIHFCSQKCRKTLVIRLVRRRISNSTLRGSRKLRKFTKNSKFKSFWNSVNSLCRCVEGSLNQPVIKWNSLEVRVMWSFTNWEIICKALLASFGKITAV